MRLNFDITFTTKNRDIVESVERTWIWFSGWWNKAKKAGGVCIVNEIASVV